MARRGLLFELQVFAGQMAASARLVRDFPQVTFVLMHAGMLEDRSPDGWTRWRAGMRALAAAPNVHVKLSGLGTFARACSVELWSPVIRETVELFGPARCMFGSNFPMLTPAECLAGLDGLGLPPDAAADFLGNNARRVFRFPTWDDFILPLPGTRAVLAVGEPVVAPKRMDAVELGQWQQRMQAELSDLYRQARAVLET